MGRFTCGPAQPMKRAAEEEVVDPGYAHDRLTSEFGYT